MSEEPQSALANSSMQHHQVFSRFPCWQGKVPDGFIVNFLGVATRTSYWPPYATVSAGYPANRCVKTEYPPFDEEYFEWIDLLESVVTAEDHFTMLELGAGWGRWTAAAAAALRHIDSLPYTLVALEAEPTHFQWMVEHLSDNGLDGSNLQLMQAAVARADGKVSFHLTDSQQGGPAEWYGQSIGGTAFVDAVSLNTLLRSLATVDLIDIDIQGAEFEVLEAGAQELDKKVKRLHIGTHSPRIEEGLRSLFGRLGWRCLRSFPSRTCIDTEWGRISFQDGVQSWLNPTYCNPSASDAAVLTEKLERSRQEGARLWAELEKERAADSLAARIIRRSGLLRDRWAPVGTRRRAALDFIEKKKN